MSREGEVQVRATLSFILSALLHGATIASVLALPQLNLFEELAGAQEPKAPKLTAATGSIDLVVGAANSAAPVAPSVPEPVEVQPVAKPAPSVAKPLAKPTAKPAPVPAPMPVAKTPIAKEAIPRKQKSASRVSSKPVATSADGDIPTMTAIASARKADQDPSTSDDSAATDEKSDAQRASIAPIESKATAQAGEEEDEKELIPPVAPAQAPAPAPAPVAAATPAPATKSASNGADTTSSQSTQTASPTGIRDAADLREAPGNPKPAYPEADRRSRREGTVVFLALVEANGTISKIQQEKTSSSASIDQSAASAFKRYRYQPGQQGWIRKAFTFSLTGEAEIAPARLRQ